MESVLSFPLHTFLEFYYWSLKINLKYSTKSFFFFFRSKSTRWKGKNLCFAFSLSVPLNYSVAHALHWPMEKKAWDPVLLAIISSSITCGCRVFITTRQDNSWSSRKKKPSPMISLASLFCHRLIQNSFQVTWTTLQSGNVLAATKGTNIWVLAVAFPQYSQITVPAVPPNILFVGKKHSL